MWLKIFEPVSQREASHREQRVATEPGLNQASAKQHQRAALTVALLVSSLAFAWQWVIVRYHYGGNWTALFCTGERMTLPPSLAFENIYRFPNSLGYDGQSYHYVAHDPLLQQGLSGYIDNPRLRYRRILLPGLAHLLALGRPGYIDEAYFGVTLLFVFLGAYWLSRYALLFGRHPAWGFGFLMVPATMVSIDRLTVDIALSALCAGFVLHTMTAAPWKLYLVLQAVCLSRETGLLLAAACCLSAASRRQWIRAALFSSTALPSLGWYVYVHLTTQPSAVNWFTGYPLGGFVIRLFELIRDRSRAEPPLLLTSWDYLALDYLGLLGMLLAFILASRLDFRKSPGPTAFAALVFTLLGIFSSAAVWGEAYAFGRILSPLLLLLAMGALRQNPRWAFLPLCLVSLGTAAPILRQFRDVLRLLIPA